MKFVVEIGEIEKHQLEYTFNQLFGSLLITINQKPVKKSVRFFNQPQREVHNFTVGDQEKSEVRIEKERKPFLGERDKIYVNNRLVKVVEGI